MASWVDKLRAALLGTTSYLDGEIIVPVPEKLFLKELAVYSAVSLIANALASCEVLVYKNGKKVKDDDWYSLNIQANINESAPQFWHKVVEKMLLADDDKGALVFVQGGNIYCADSYAIKEKRPFKMTGHLYDSVVIDDLQMNKTFTGRDCMIFKMENRAAKNAIDLMYSDVNTLVGTAMQHYTEANIQRWKFKVDAAEMGTPEFQKEWQTKLQAAVKNYVSGNSQVMVEYNRRELVPVQTGSSSKETTASDSVTLWEKIYDVVARAYHIPPGLMTAGNYNLTDVMSQFLTFVVDPIAETISKTLTAAYGADKWKSGSYYKVDTSKIKHFDIFDMAVNVDKLIACGFSSINEARHEAGWDYVGDPDDDDNWCNWHVLTKNYETQDTEKIEKGGETDAQEQTV